MDLKYYTLAINQMCINQCKVEYFILYFKNKHFLQKIIHFYKTIQEKQRMDQKGNGNYQYDQDSMEPEDYDYQNIYDENEGYEEYHDNQIQGYEQYENYSYDQYENQRANSTKKQYQVLPYNGLLQQLHKSLNIAKQMTALPIGWCLILLRDFKWDVDFLPEYFQDMNKYRTKIGYDQKYSDPNKITKDFGTCEVCCTQSDEMLANICGHAFCKDCWNFHLTSNIKSNVGFLTCMGGCGCPILYQSVLLILRICDSQNQKYIDKYLRNLCQMFSSVHKSYQFCTGADCNNCIKILNFNVQTVRCTCGKSFCFRCKSDDHSPCSCQQKQKWVQNVLKQEADAKWMAVNAKLCPWCKKAVQRSAGCNFMACVCGKSFCYLCSKPWEPDHKDHFKCHIYKKSAQQNVNRQKQILQKMNFYAQRYLDSQASAVQNKAIDVFQKRKYLFKVLHIQLADTQFIQSAYKFSIQCCDALKWIYAYTYYVKFKNQFEKERFQFNQGQFERYKVNLLKKLAVDLRKFIQKVQKSQKQGLLLNQQKILELVDEFKQIKTSIVNYYTSTKSYKDKFIAELQSMSQEESLVKKKSHGKKQVKKQQPKPSTIQTRSKASKKQQKSMAGKLYDLVTGKK